MTKRIYENKKHNQGKGGFAVTSEKYDPIRKAILSCTPKKKDGIAFDDLCERVGARVPKSLFPRAGSVSWYTKVVQLDMEARGEIARVSGATPMRLKRLK